MARSIYERSVSYKCIVRREKGRYIKDMTLLIAQFNALPDRTRGILFIMFCVLVWSGWMIVSSYGVRNSLSAYDITALRFGAAGLVMLPLLIKRGWKMGPWGILSGILLSALMGSVYNVVTISGMKFAPASHAAGLINSSVVAMTTIGGILLLKEKTTTLKLIGIAISMLGVLTIVDVLNAESLKGDMALGHLFFLIGGTMWALYALLMRIWKLDPVHVAAGVCVYSALTYLPVYFTMLPVTIGWHNWDAALFQAVYQGLINSVLSLIAYNRGVALLGVSQSSAYIPLIPVIATLTAIPLLGQEPTLFDAIGIALVAGGVLLSSGAIRRRA
jgi:drug/metabolite transporter (DMT)-like permease